MSSPRYGLRYRPELDGLRALAVLVVVVFHVSQPSRFAGYVGVDVFFALSGFLITTILLREIEDHATIRLGRFYVRRLLRLYPALILMLVCSFPFYRSLGGTIGQQAKEAAIAATYTSNLYMTYRHEWLSGFTHTWSLALEEQYYLVWPVTLLLAVRARLSRRTIGIALAAAAVVTAGLNVHDYHYGTIAAPLQTTSTGLLAGSALALLLLPGAGRSARVPRPELLGLVGAALFVGELIVFSSTRAIPAGFYSPAAVLATLLIIASTTAIRTGWLVRSFSIAPAVALGRISYGVYLWHYPVLLVLNHYLSTLSRWGILPIDLAVTLIIATLSYRFVETPFLRLKDTIGAPKLMPTAPLAGAEGS